MNIRLCKPVRMAIIYGIAIPLAFFITDCLTGSVRVFEWWHYLLMFVAFFFLGYVRVKADGYEDIKPNYLFKAIQTGIIAFLFLFIGIQWFYLSKTSSNIILTVVCLVAFVVEIVRAIMNLKTYFSQQK